MTELDIELPAGKCIYFASDFHLGVPDHDTSLVREKRIVRWLESIRHDAQAIFLLGDIFDFWFEYQQSIPKGFIRLQGKLAELGDGGVAVYFFTGNHDMWMFDYFPKELGIPVFRGLVLVKASGQRLLIGHGDGLGPGDSSYKLLKKVFNSRICQWLFARLHPNLGMAIANRWSRHSRITNMKKEEKFVSEQNEFLLTWCKQLEAKEHHDFYVFGHRHLPLDLAVGEHSRYINTGEWVNFNTFAVYANNDLKLKTFQA